MIGFEEFWRSIVEAVLIGLSSLSKKWLPSLPIGALCDAMKTDIPYSHILLELL
jgi:hypothetical protein